MKHKLIVVLLGSAALMAAAERVHTQAPPWFWKPAIPTVGAGNVDVLHVRGNVHMLVGAGGNITVHAGSDGILIVDSGIQAMSGKVIEAIRSVSKGPLRYIVNTTERPEHVGGNSAVAAIGSTIPFRPPEDVRVSDGGARAKPKASVISFVSTLERMSAPTGQKAPWPEDAWPDNTYSTPQKKLYFNDEPVVVMHVPGNTDGNSIVHFRIADVISVGDLVDLTAYPVIDVKAGGSIQQLFDALYRVIDVTVPNRKSEAGTLVIPGHGRLADQPDVVYYNQMVGIVRDRIKDMIARGLTLQQVKAERPTRDYDTRYGSPDAFIEGAYESLKNTSTN